LLLVDFDDGDNEDELAECMVDDTELSDSLGRLCIECPIFWPLLS
jgi:hypothetical protein